MGCYKFRQEPRREDGGFIAEEARHFTADDIHTESNRYAAEMPVISLLQAKARSSHLWPALCASKCFANKTDSEPTSREWRTSGTPSGMGVSNPGTLLRRVPGYLIVSCRWHEFYAHSHHIWLPVRANGTPL